MAIALPAQSGHGVIDVDPALHDQLPGLADRLARFVEHLADTDGALGLVPLASQSERDLLSEWGTGPAPAISPTDCLHELFESQALRTPDAVAVRDGEEELTYRELNNAADALASVLRRDGVGPDVGVGICVARSPALIIGLLGILKAGGFYVPLDPTLPRTRLRFLIEDADLQTIVTVRANAAGLPAGGLLYLDELDPQACGTPRCETHSQARGSDSAAAYVLYTSGSTGEPKGVRVEHRSVVNFVQAAMAEYRITPTDRVLQFASIGFDTSVEEIFPTLASGATLVLRPEDMLGSAKSFLDRCARLGITVLDLPTAYWHTLVPQLHRGAASLWPKLRLVIIGGEAADSNEVQDWFAATGGSVDMINTYGPTEATVVSTWARLTPGESGGGGAPIGSPLPGVSVEVLDRFGLPVPVGVTGELVIGGAGVASGYLHRPQLTSEKFGLRSDPTGHRTRLFHTGDLCCWRPDGMLEFVGRFDEQVKVRGHRIELREIELVLEAQPAIAHAAVVARSKDRPGADTVLRACVVAHSADEGLDIALLRVAVRDQLPDWMIPGEWFLLDQMPLSGNGKVDRRALASDASPGVRLSASVRSGTVDEATTLLEQEVLDIWRKLFGQDSVHRDDNFFDLGGDSLLAVCFAEELERRLGHSVPITALFEYPTVEALTRALAEQSWTP
ncbi:MAG: non-ribosomal peptide synthetase, partial [Actinomycetes bacterium]